MSQQNKENKAGFRPLLIAVTVILAAVITFAYFNRSASNGNNTGAAIDMAEAVATAAGEVMVLSDANFDKVISEGVVLVDFWAAWCAPCRIQGPIVDELAREIGTMATISKLDVDDHGPLASRYQVRSIPTLIIFKDGQAVQRFVGVQQKETLAAAIREHL